MIWLQDMWLMVQRRLQKFERKHISGTIKYKCQDFQSKNDNGLYLKEDILKDIPTNTKSILSK